MNVVMFIHRCGAYKWDDNAKTICLCGDKTINQDAICDECKAKKRGKTLSELSEWDLEMFNLDRRIRQLKGECGLIYICGKDGCCVD